jgi:hypothetical protein
VPQAATAKADRRRAKAADDARNFTGAVEDAVMLTRDGAKVPRELRP